MGTFKRQRVMQLPSGADFNTVREAVVGLVTSVGGFSDELAKLTAGGLTLGSNTPGLIKKLAFRMPSAAPFKPVDPYSSDWKDGSPVTEILMEPGGVVRMRGQRFAQGAYAAAGAPVGSSFETIPDGYRPEGNQQIPITVGLKAGGFSWGVLFQTASTGVCSLLGAAGNISTFSWDYATWLATNAAPPHQFDEGAWPLRVEHGLEGVCRGLVPLGFRLLGQSGQNVGAGAPVVDWQDVGDGTLRINGVWGLQWGKSYELLCYLTPEEE